MPIVKLTKPHFLGDKNPRYFPEGSLVNWNGPLSKAMEPARATAAAPANESEDMRTQRERVAVREAAARRAQATPVLLPGKADKPMADWAPNPRPAFSVLHARDPETIQPGVDEAALVRMAASPPGAGSHPGEGPAGPALTPDPNAPTAKTKGARAARGTRAAARGSRAAAKASK